MIAPVLVALMVGGIEFSMILFSYNSAQNAARDVARRLATNRITSSEASAAAKQQLPSWMSQAATVTVTQSAPSDANQNKITVEISFTAVSASPTRVLAPIYSGKTLHAKTTMQQEAPL